MKSLCQAAWLLTVACGNFVVFIVAESSLFNNQVINKLLMFINQNIINRLVLPEVSDHLNYARLLTLKK